MPIPQVKSNGVEIRNFLHQNQASEMARDVVEGLSKPRKSLPSKYFYDAEGCRLFERICSTRDYYPTRTELSILDGAAGQIMRFFANSGGDLVELGSGSSTKVRKLLDRMDRKDLSSLRYVPVDISEASLKQSAGELAVLYPGLPVLGIVADFTRHLDVLPSGRKLITFLGGTIGNLCEQESAKFLSKIATLMNPEDRFLIGFDMLKSADILEAAYNDGEGITSAFNLNILKHINRELNADFDLNQFEHVAFFNARRERVEMHLRANRKVRAGIPSMRFAVDIEPGETVRTELCCKFSRKSAVARFDRAGLRVVRWFTDPREWFSLVELRSLRSK